jgi:hypothetical protein
LRALGVISGTPCNQNDLGKSVLVEVVAEAGAEVVDSWLAITGFEAEVGGFGAAATAEVVVPFGCGAAAAPARFGFSGSTDADGVGRVRTLILGRESTLAGRREARLFVVEPEGPGVLEGAAVRVGVSSVE